MEKGYKEFKTITIKNAQYDYEEAFNLFKLIAEFKGAMNQFVRSGKGMREYEDSYFGYFPHLQDKYTLDRIEEVLKISRMAGIEFITATKFNKPIWKN